MTVPQHSSDGLEEGQTARNGKRGAQGTRSITPAAEICFQLLTGDTYHLSLNSAIRVKHQISIARIHLVQREVDHIRFELNAGGGGTQTPDALKLEIELLMDVTINYRPELTGCLGCLPEFPRIQQTDVLHPASCAFDGIVVHAD